MNDESVSELEEIEEMEEGIEVTTPVIIGMGKTKKKHIKRLKKGKGRLMDEVVDVLDEVAEELGDELDGKVMVPIVIVYKEKKKKNRYRLRFPF